MADAVALHHRRHAGSLSLSAEPVEPAEKRPYRFIENEDHTFESNRIDGDFR